MTAVKAQIVTHNGASKSTPERKAFRNVMRRDFGSLASGSMKDGDRCSCGGGEAKVFDDWGGDLLQEVNSCDRLDRSLNHFVMSFSTPARNLTLTAAAFVALSLLP